MSLRTRALVFSTFFGSCLAIGLLLASMTTNHWVRAYPRRGNSTEAKGDVNLGLFYGQHHLNPGFGVRTTQIEGELCNYINLLCFTLIVAFPQFITSFAPNTATPASGYGCSPHLALDSGCWHAP